MPLGDANNEIKFSENRASPCAVRIHTFAVIELLLLSYYIYKYVRSEYLEVVNVHATGVVGPLFSGLRMTVPRTVRQTVLESFSWKTDMDNRRYTTAYLYHCA